MIASQVLHNHTRLISFVADSEEVKDEEKDDEERRIAG
jgi:hypothetical protein